MSDQYSGFHGIVIPGTLRDSIFVLEGLLEQETGLNPTEIMTDTAGASELVFGLFWLLGYQFSPRPLMPVLRFSGEWTMMPTMAC
ncbi:Tn3 family transposase [Escherichia coli]|uniref:Tn3 family transposase n=1 Tax=Escherichia coli TaxID=562 RepID=UPI00388D3BB8